ncbi:MAG: hypothetical protein JOS17DRAFT_490622 [Linnemannia elongata]|nr:MAG: hypothetical protein JOS17DRAFT_490622 [Linnemannia elongata]
MTTSTKHSSSSSFRFSFIKGFHKKDNAQPSNTSEITPRPPRVNPVHIPEILEKILSYLDDHTSRKISRLVCRQWFFLTSPARQVVFDGHRHGRTINKTLSRMAGAGGLWWRSDHDYWLKPPPQRVHWGFLKKALQLVHERYQQQQQQLLLQQQQQRQSLQISSTQDDQEGHLIRTRTKLYSPLRILELVENPRVSYLISDILPYMSTLTVLRICPTTGESFDMNEILVSCPLLEVFHLLPTEKLRVFGPWDVMTKLRKAQNEAIPAGQGEGHPPRTAGQLPLQSLILRNVFFYQSCIEELLNYTPHLTELQLVVWSPDEDSTFDPPSFYQHLQSLDHISLDSFHFSFEGKFDDNTPELREMARKICPNRHKWLFWTGDLTPAMTRCLLEHRNVVTTLELVYNQPVICGPSGLLHQYLCNSPQLLHLRASNTAYLFDHLDLHQRTLLYEGHYSIDPLTAGQSYGSARPGVWACRGLKTLHLAFDSQTDRLLFAPVCLRIVFGYLTRVVPRLQDLQIVILSCFSYGRGNVGPPLRLTLQSGFCLLSRLKNLEKLRIGCDGGSVDCQRSDIEWMIPSGQSPRKIDERRKVVSGWTQQLAEEESMEIKRSQRFSFANKAAAQARSTGPSLSSSSSSSSTSKQVVDIWNNVDPELKQDLQNLGRLLDVKTMLDEMADKDFRCWPYIQKVAFHRPIEMGLSPERELKEMFPATTLSGVRLRLGQKS